MLDEIWFVDRDQLDSGEQQDPKNNDDLPGNDESKDLKETKKNLPFMFQGIELPKYNSKTDYYLEYWKTYMSIKLSWEDLTKWAEKRNDKIRKLLKIMKYFEDNTEKSVKEWKQNSRKKHMRRTAKEISKEFKWPYKWGKHYGSEGSLNLHMKLKHAGGNKTDREKLAKALVIAQFRGEKLPEIDLNLPSGAIEEAAKDLNIQFDEKVIKELSIKARVCFDQYLEACRAGNNIDPVTNLPYAKN